MDGFHFGNATATTSALVSKHSKLFMDYLEERGHHYTTPVYHPEENGLVEVFNRTLKHGVQAFGNLPWMKGLGNLLKSYRLCPGTDGRSPAEIFFGRTLRTDWTPNRKKPSRRTRSEALSSPGTAPAPVWTSWSRYQAGDLVLSKSPWSPKGTSPWKGPKKVIKVLGAYSFLLDDKQIWHANQLKKWVRDSLAPEQWIEQDSALQPQAAPTPLRRSTRSTRGIPPQRYRDVYSFNRASRACASGLHAGDG